MKTPNEIKSWVDMLLSRRPNAEDRNYLEAIKCYMDRVERPHGEVRLTTSNKEAFNEALDHAIKALEKANNKKADDGQDRYE